MVSPLRYNQDVILLSLDTCEARGSVCVLKDGASLAEEAHGSSEDYSSWLLLAAERTLARAGLALREVDVYVPASGPGSFTGLRVGLTTVKGLAEVYQKPIVPVSRMEAIASFAGTQADWIVAFADAQRGQVFGAIYRRQVRGLARVGETQVSSPEEFVRWVAERAALGRLSWVSTDPDHLLGLPEWRVREQAGELMSPAPAVLAPRIGEIGYDRALAGQFVDAAHLEADYVRRSDAEIFWKGAAHARSHGR